MWGVYFNQQSEGKASKRKIRKKSRPQKNDEREKGSAGVEKQFSFFSFSCFALFFSFTLVQFSSLKASSFDGHSGRVDVRCIQPTRRAQRKNKM